MICNQLSMIGQFDRYNGGKPPAEVHLLAEHLQAEFNVKDRVILQKCRFDERRPNQPILKIFL